MKRKRIILGLISTIITNSYTAEQLPVGVKKIDNLSTKTIVTLVGLEKNSQQGQSISGFSPSDDEQTLTHFWNGNANTRHRYFLPTIIKFNNNEFTNLGSLGRIKHSEAKVACSLGQAYLVLFEQGAIVYWLNKDNIPKNIAEQLPLINAMMIKNQVNYNCS